ncbi:MAG TPA: GSCFA domain-containing protein [Flavobacterium sp.]|jgi:hypothetical protein
MQFRTQVPIPAYDQLIDYDSRIVSLGSCFAVNIAEKFRYYKFQNILNPVGILFHPLALEKFIRYAVEGHKFSDPDIFLHKDLWHSFDAHSDLSRTTKVQLLQDLNTSATSAKSAITEASHIIITLGTSWVYRHIESGELVANCHKVPQNQFSKELLSVSENVESLQNIIELLKSVNNNVHIIFTVSPVRHIKDGFVENQRSKAHLITALHEVLQSATAVYFPSYEIMMDELRDYRFYSHDMLHPNQTAIDYIWERFLEAAVSKGAFDTMQEVDAVQKSLSHRAFNPESEQHQQFLLKVQGQINHLQKKFPHIVF